MGQRITLGYILFTLCCCCAPSPTVSMSAVESSLDQDHVNVEKAMIIKRAASTHRKPRQCQDKFEVITGHTMCINDTHTRPNHTVQAMIEDLHNQVRQKVVPPASDMMKLSYIRTLEIVAQTWAEACRLHHDDPYKRFIPGRYRVGQNILISPGRDLSWADVINTWVNENTTFHYNKTGNGVNYVGNYTQIVWAETLLVGCGKAKCGTSYFYVCNYAPRIDVNRISVPYERSATGQPAGQGCVGHHPNSSSALCDCSGKYCLNGGRLDLATCNCVCVTGVKTYDANLCELNCTANGDHTSCGSLTQTSCETDPTVAFRCPWLCNVCPYAGSSYREGSVPMPLRSSASIMLPSNLLAPFFHTLIISVIFVMTFF